MLAPALFLAAGAVAVEGAAVSSQATAAVAAPISNLSEDELVLYAVQLDTLTLSDALSAYGDPSDPLMPLGELARLLDLDIDIAPAQRRVTGRIGEGLKSLTIDLDSATARLGGNAIALDASEIAVGPNDIFMKASALSRFIPAEFKVDGEALSITIVPTETLPIQARMERLRRLRDLGRDPGTQEEVTRIDSPYALFTPPSLDVILDGGSDTRGNPFSRRFEIRVAGDLLYTGFQGFVGSDDRAEPAEARILFERRSLSGNLLGPLGATRVSGGDVFTPSLPLGARSIAGRGFSFSTVPLEQASVFDTVDLRGELPIGFDVELYINDVLRSGQRGPVQGRYEFLNVPLVRGINVVRIVSYGPRGERSEQVRIVNVGGGQLKKGQTTVELGAVEQERPLLTLNRRRESFLGPGAGRLRVVGNVAHGLTEGVTLVAGAALYPSPEGEERQLVTSGVRTSLYGFAVHGDAAVDQRGGIGLGGGVAGQPFGVSVIAEHFEYRHGFVDENQVIGDAGRRLAHHSELTLDFSLPSLGGKVIPLSFRGLRNGYQGGGSNMLGGLRASTTVADTLVSAGLDYQRTSTPGMPAQQQLGGIFAVSRFLNYKWQLRGALDYELLDEAGLRAVSFTADRGLSDRVALRFGAGHLFQEPKSTSVQAGATFRLPFADIALTADYAAPRQDWGIGLRLAFGLGYDPGARRYRLTPPGPASGGSASFSAFVDSNGNGRLDKGEEPVPNVSIQGGERQGKTDADGRAFVVGLGTAPTGRLQVGTDKIDNFYVSTPPQAIEFSPRPGKVIEIRYPLTPTAEVMTRLIFKRGGETVGLSAVRLRLVREGAEDRVATTEFDGSAVFSDIPAGEYRLELDPAQAHRLHMRLSEPVTVAVAADGNPLPDVRAEIVFDQPPAGAEP